MTEDSAPDWSIHHPGIHLLHAWAHLPGKAVDRKTCKPPRNLETQIYSTEFCDVKFKRKKEIKKSF